MDHYNTEFHQIRVKSSIIVVPLQYVVNFPIKVANWVITSFSTQQALIQENAQLHAQLLLLNAKLQKEYAIENENTQLRELLQSHNQAPERVEAAQLLAVSSDPFIQQVILDKGSNQKVYVGQPVLDAYGVMGQVIQVDPITSRVMLLTDSASAIPVQIMRNGVRAIAVGDSTKGDLRLQNLTETTDIQEGDMVITSGLGQRYPFGYPVGKVVFINKITGNQFINVRVEPAAHINRSRLVLLLWPTEVNITPEMKKGLSQSREKSQQKENKH